MQLRYVHASGRFTATGVQLAQALNFYAHEKKANVITITEVSPKRLWGPLREWAKANKWYFYHPLGAGRDECAVLSKFPLSRTKAFRTTPLKLRSARDAPLYMVSAKLEKGPWFSVMHTPAHNGGLSHSGKYAWPTRVYMSMMTGVHAARMKMTGKLAISADWNLDLDRQEVRDELAKPYPNMKWGWQAGQDPTEGGRVIDGTLTNMKIVEKSVTLAAQPGFDHRAVLTVLDTSK